MKRGLQVLLALLSLIPVLVAVLGLVFGAGLRLPEANITPNFDSHYRYLTGYYLSLSLLAWWIIPNVEKHTTLLRIMGGSIFVGGLGRLISGVQVGWPAPFSIVFMVIELLFPLLLIWQANLPRSRA